MKVTAKDLFNLIYSLENNVQDNLKWHYSYMNNKSVMEVTHFIQSLGFEVRYDVFKHEKASLRYELGPRHVIFVEGTVYEYTCHTQTASGIPHLSITEAFRNIASQTKKGDFVLDWNGDILNGMWHEEAIREGNVLIHIVNGRIKEISVNRGNIVTTDGVPLSGGSNAKRFSVSGYSPFPVQENYIIDYLKMLKCIDRLQLNKYLNTNII